MDFILSNIYIILAVSSVLHILEEYVYPGGFAIRFNEILSLVDLTITKFQIILINSLYLSLVIFVLITHSIYPLLSLGTVFLALLNGVVHLLTSIKQKRYFPGLITGALLYIPLGVVTFLYSPGDFDLKIMALFLAVILHSIPLLIIVIGKPFIKKTIIR